MKLRRQIIIEVEADTDAVVTRAPEDQERRFIQEQLRQPLSEILSTYHGSEMTGLKVHTDLVNL